MATMIGSRVTYAEFRDLPDDGVLYELLDGTIVTRASPTGRHQDLIGDLYARLRVAANLVQALASEPQAPDVDPDRVRFLEQWHLRRNERRDRPRRRPPSS